MPEPLDIAADLKAVAATVDAALRARLDRAGPSSPLLEAVRYCVEAGGKRLRPALVLWCCELCGGREADALPPALAIECVHAFSLVHDDLPALDDDDLRRGRPTCHKRFGEALAILAGDALLALAFEILAEGVADPQRCRDMLAELAAATGCGGMIGGEAADLRGQSLPPDGELVASIHAAKTARLFEAACALGAIAAGANPDALTALRRYGHELGMVFQAVDDLLDVTGRSEVVGKRTGKDGPSGKQTYPRAVGIEESRRLLAASASRAVTALGPFGQRGGRLAAVVRFVVQREY